MEGQPVELTDELLRSIEDLCASKAEEFHLLGYDQVTREEIWECVQAKYAKTGLPALHRLVNDILSLKPTDFMNWVTMSIYRGPSDLKGLDLKGLGL